VTSIDDWVLLERHLENTVKDNIEIKTISVGDNKEHINQLYLLEESEILEQETDHNRIYGNRELNFALFGELVVHPDGTVRLNENTEVIGSVEDDWTDMLNKALNKPNPWLMTRGKTKPCSNCIYRDLCPPIRNLELYMGDKLACADYYKTLPKQDTAN
jgi:pseudo-rSAM protein